MSVKGIGGIWSIMSTGLRRFLAGLGLIVLAALFLTTMIFCAIFKIGGFWDVVGMTITIIILAVGGGLLVRQGLYKGEE